MRFRRWRLATLMGLVGLVGLGIKGAILLLPKHDIVRDRLAGQGFAAPLPRSPAIEAELVALLDDSEAKVRWYALLWLDETDSTNPAMVPRLIEHLMAETAEMRHQNRWDPDQIDPARSLIRCQLPASVIAPLLRPALSGSVDGLARSRAIEVLADAASRAGKPSDPTLVQLLLGALNDLQPTNRLRAAEGLALLDDAARRRAATVLAQQVQGPDRVMALVAAANLARFDPEGEVGAKALADRLDANTDDPTTRVEDLYLLGRIGPPSRVAVPAIVRAMIAPDSRQFSGFPLQRFRSQPGAAYYIDNIGVFLPGDTSSTVSGEAGPMGTLALSRIGPEAEREAETILARMLRDEPETQRLAAAKVLGDLGLRASSAFEELLALVDRTPSTPGGKDWFKTRQLIGTLAKIRGGDDPQLVASLIRLLGSGDDLKRIAAASALAHLNPPAPAAIPALVGAGGDAMQGLRWQVAIALGRYDHQHRDAVTPTLNKLLDDPDNFVRLLAAESLAQLGADTTRAVPVALAILQSKDDNHRWRAAEVLGRLGPAAQSAVPTLRALQSDPYWAVREHAAKALTQIEAPTPTDAGAAHSDAP